MQLAANRHMALIMAFLLLAGPGSALAAGNAHNGMKIFKKCAACHSLEQGKKKIGPSLHGVIGRMAGTAEGYKYSKAMAAHGKAGTVWAADTLDTYLQAPRKVVPGTKMSFPGLKKTQDRADVIAYLQGFSG